MRYVKKVKSKKANNPFGTKFKYSNVPLKRKTKKRKYPLGFYENY